MRDVLGTEDRPRSSCCATPGARSHARWLVDPSSEGTWVKRSGSRRLARCGVRTAKRRSGRENGRSEGLRPSFRGVLPSSESVLPRSESVLDAFRDVRRSDHVVDPHCVDEDRRPDALSGSLFGVPGRSERRVGSSLGEIGSGSGVRSSPVTHKASPNVEGRRSHAPESRVDALRSRVDALRSRVDALRSTEDALRSRGTSVR